MQVSVNVSTPLGTRGLTEGGWRQGQAAVDKTIVPSVSQMRPGVLFYRPREGLCLVKATRIRDGVGVGVKGGIPPPKAWN